MPMQLLVTEETRGLVGRFFLAGNQVRLPENSQTQRVFIISPHDCVRQREHVKTAM